MSKSYSIALLPEVALEKIFSFLTYDEVSKNRLATLSVDNARKIMLLGHSKDYALCKSLRKNGDKCTAFVNKNACEYCIYHVKQEYQKCTQQRSELQANFSGGGRGLTALRNKVLGKNEVFYAGKSYTAIPAKANRKLAARDANLLHSLDAQSFIAQRRAAPQSKKQMKAAQQLDVSKQQRLKDMELLRKLTGIADVPATAAPSDFQPAQFSTTVTVDDAKTNALDVIARLKSATRAKEAAASPGDEQQARAHAQPLPTGITNAATAAPSDVQLHAEENRPLNARAPRQLPRLSEPVQTTAIARKAPFLSGSAATLIDLNVPIVNNRRRSIDRAKSHAIDWIHRNGPLARKDPNSVRAPHGIKRPLSVSVAANEGHHLAAGALTNVEKKARTDATDDFTSERFKRMMAAASAHTDLLERHDNDEQAKYFNKLEMKERMEEKMQTTYKVACKAVKCLTCKYTSFSASDMCKQERHPLKVFDAMKRFFKCGECGQRTVCLQVVPTTACKNCGSGRWERTTMMKEARMEIATHALSIRGDERKFINSGGGGDLNLMVPESD